MQSIATDARSPPRTGLIFGALVLGMLLAALDQTIVATRCRRSSATSAALTSFPGS